MLQIRVCFPKTGMLNISQHTTACVHACVLNYFTCAQLFVNPWTVACQAPLSMGFFQTKILKWVAMPPPWHLPDPRSKPSLLCLLHWQVSSLPLALPGTPTTAYIPSIFLCLGLCSFPLLSGLFSLFPEIGNLQ